MYFGVRTHRHRHDDAERDCTAVLTLDVSNVKAFFRRGQARAAQNKLVDAQKGKHTSIPLPFLSCFAQDEVLI